MPSELCASLVRFKKKKKKNLQCPKRRDRFVNADLHSFLFVLQLHISVSPEKVKLNLDCQEVAEKPIKEANNITLEGTEVLGKMVKSGGGRKQSATVSEKRLFCRGRASKTVGTYCRCTIGF